MSWHLGTTVQIPFILRQQVSVMDDEAVPEEVLEHGPVKLVAVRLVDDVEFVVKVLAGEEGVKVAEDKELVKPVPIWHNDGNNIAMPLQPWGLASLVLGTDLG